MYQNDTQTLEAMEGGAWTGNSGKWATKFDGSLAFDQSSLAGWPRPILIRSNSKHFLTEPSQHSRRCPPDTNYSYTWRSTSSTQNI